MFFEDFYLKIFGRLKFFYYLCTTKQKDMNFAQKETLQLYKANKETKVGCYIICPICGKKVIKTHYAQAFCTNECKVQYHNKKQRGKRTKYFREYNQRHPERLERGFTKGYINGNVSEGVKEKKNGNIWYDSLGRPHSNDFFNPTLTDMLDWKCNCEWHDDDWCEGAWGE